MEQVSFAQREKLQPGDVIVVPKSSWNIVEHYIVYWGKFEGQEYYLENNNTVGVRWINEALLIKENQRFTRIRRFQGDEQQRALAIKRAVSKLRTKYDLENFNCENYANYVQYGISFSQQVYNSIEIAKGIGLCLTAFVVVRSFEG